MLYLYQGIFFTGILLLYIKIAKYFDITDKPNERSSHNTLIIRGGGIVFPISIFSCYVLYGFGNISFAVGFLLIAGISFLDDILSLKNYTRFLIQFIAALLLLVALNFHSFSLIWWILLLVFMIGWMNAFNFMDGINGMTPLYALVCIGSLYYVNLTIHFTSPFILTSLAIALVVFSFFNVRRQAKLFAGDVGSISLAYILGYLMINLVIITGNIEYILFFSVYATDTVFTIFERLKKREDIFQPHRSHLYQILANEKRFSHIAVSCWYALAQLLINSIVILTIEKVWIAPGVLVLGILSTQAIFYLLIKKKVAAV